MPYKDDELVMISALQHYVFCRRQCALIHIEQVWSENFLTAAGRVLHERVDAKGRETRRGVRLATSLRLVSLRLGITGVADMVEFHQTDAPDDAAGARIAAPLPRLSQFWRPFPVEYKRGKPKPHRADEVQLCAQAFCLEEMLGVTIPAGALFYGATRRRMDVPFDRALRCLTQETADAVHRLIAEGATPPAEYRQACKACSLIDICQPKPISSRDSARKWLETRIGQAVADSRREEEDAE